MKNKSNVTLNDAIDFIAEIEGSVEFNVYTTSAHDYLEVSLNSEYQDFSNENNIFKFKNDDKFGKEDLLGTLKDKKASILDSLVSLLNHVKEKTDAYEPIIVNLYINNIKNIKLSGDNIKLDFSNIKLLNVDIDCANFKINNESSMISNLQIRASNLKGRIIYNQDNNKIDIMSNNATLDIYKKDFNGALNIKSSNSNLKNISAGDLNLGELKANLNNSTVNVY